MASSYFSAFPLKESSATFIDSVGHPSYASSKESINSSGTCTVPSFWSRITYEIP